MLCSDSSVRCAFCLHCVTLCGKRDLQDVRPVQGASVWKGVLQNSLGFWQFLEALESCPYTFVYAGPLRSVLCCRE